VGCSLLRVCDVFGVYRNAGCLLGVLDGFRKLTLVRRQPSKTNGLLNSRDNEQLSS